MSYEQPPTTGAGPADESPAADESPVPVADPPSYDQPPAEPPDAPPDVPPYGGYQPVQVYVRHYSGSVAASTRAVGIMGRIIVAMVALPIIGGVIAGVAHDASNQVPDFPSFSSPEPVLGSPDNPRPVAEGRPFTLDGLSYLAGWRIGKNPAGFATGRNLRVTNPTGVAAHPGLRLMLMRGDTVVATTTCVLAAVDPGATETVLCGGADELPARYDTITVATLF